MKITRMKKTCHQQSLVTISSIVSSILLICNQNICLAQTTMPSDALSPLLQDSLKTQSKKTEQPLQAIIQMQANLQILSGDIVLKKFRGLKIRVTNNTDRPLIFDGDSATATIQGATKNCASLVQMEEINRLPHTFGQKLSSDLKATTTAAVTVGAVQTAEGFKKQFGPILPRYERDERRREVEDGRFGQRVIYPGDFSEGIVYFLTNESLQGSSIKVPATSLYDNKDKAALDSEPPAQNATGTTPREIR